MDNLPKPTTKPTNYRSQEEADLLLRLYGKTTNDKFNQMNDVEFTVWVANNLSNIERLLFFIQRETARAASTKEVDENLNSHMLAQSQILNKERK